MNSVDASATGAYLAVGTGQSAQVGGAVLAAAAAAATAVVRETDGSGRILFKLAAPIGDTAYLTQPVNYVGNVHVTITGAAAQFNLLQP